jgi:hypothetical protein
MMVATSDLCSEMSPLRPVYVVLDRELTVKSIVSTAFLGLAERPMEEISSMKKAGVSRPELPI